MLIMSLSQISIFLIIGLLVPFGLIIAQSTEKETSEVEEKSDDAKTDLDKAESKDPQKLEIIKQIRRVNDDGSYTVGYEADDGTFKIESRDVLGNVKGTYGYVDGNGEIKRVSYTANNGTNGLRSSVDKNPAEEVVHIPKQNRTGYAASTTRRPPSLAYLTSTGPTPTRPTVIQPIPKKRIIHPSSDRPPYSSKYSFRQNDYTTTTPRKGEPTTTVVYAQSLPSQKPIINIRPTLLPGSYKNMEQISRPDKLEITDHVSKVQISNNRETSTSKPVVEEIDENEKDPDTERKNVKGNFLRRQLPTDRDENYEAQQQIIYSQPSRDDSSHIYGGVPGTARPLFTTGSPRIPSLVLAAKSRAAQLQNLINSHSDTTSTTEKVYVKPPRRKQEFPEDTEETTEPSSENTYLTQGPVTVQIPANRDIPEATEEEKRVYRRPVAYRNREFVRQAPPPPDVDYSGPRQIRIPIPQAYPQPQPGFGPPHGFSPIQQNEHEQYLRETSPDKNSGAAANPSPYAGDPNNPAPFSPRGSFRQPQPYLPYSRQNQNENYEQQSQPIPLVPSQFGPYGRAPPSHYYMNPDRPLTARDFERLLNLLIVRHQQIQRYNYLPQLNPYLGGIGAGGGYNPYSPYNYQQQIPRPPLYNPYDARYNGYTQPPPYQPPYGQYSDTDQLYQNPGAMANNQVPYAGQRLIPRKKQFGPQYFGAQSGPPYPERPEYSEATQPVGQQQEYLPSNVREELLYRMLLLAMQPSDFQNPEQLGSSPEYATSEAVTTTTVAPTKYRKPVRSVQILGEEE